MRERLCPKPVLFCASLTKSFHGSMARRHCVKRLAVSVFVIVGTLLLLSLLKSPQENLPSKEPLDVWCARLRRQLGRDAASRERGNPKPTRPSELAQWDKLLDGDLGLVGREGRTRRALILLCLGDEHAGTGLTSTQLKHQHDTHVDEINSLRSNGRPLSEQRPLPVKIIEDETDFKSGNQLHKLAQEQEEVMSRKRGISSQNEIDLRDLPDRTWQENNLPWRAESNLIEKHLFNTTAELSNRNSQANKLPPKQVLAPPHPVQKAIRGEDSHAQVPAELSDRVLQADWLPLKQVLDTGDDVRKVLPREDFLVNKRVEVSNQTLQEKFPEQQLVLDAGGPILAKNVSNVSQGAINQGNKLAPRRKLRKVIRVVRKGRPKSYESAWYKDVLNGKLAAFLLPGQGNSSGEKAITEQLWKFDHPDPELLYLYGRLFRHPWTPNKSRLEKIRKELYEGGFNSQIHFVVSQTNSPPYTSLRYYFNKKPFENGTVPYEWRYIVRKKFWNRLPQSNPIASSDGKAYRRCAVVGNSGILLNSMCGADIDSYDMVFRCNAAPIAKFATDAGWKSNVTSFNPTIFLRRYNALSTPSSLKNFHDDISQYHGYVWFPCFGSPSLNEICLRPFLSPEPKPPNEPQFIFGHPDHFLSLWDFWKSRNMTKTPSTGFYMTHTALQLCEQTHLYGFWPYPVRLDSQQFRRVPYHYFDKILGSPKHGMNVEFSVYAQYHELGILRMHIGECASNGANDDDNK